MVTDSAYGTEFAYFGLMRPILIICVLFLSGCGQLYFVKQNAARTVIIPGIEDGNIQTKYHFSVIAQADVDDIGTIFMDGWESYRTHEDQTLSVRKGDTVAFHWTHSEPANQNSDNHEILDVAQISVMGDSTQVVMYSIRQSSLPRDYVFSMQFMVNEVPHFFTIDSLDIDDRIAMP